MKRNHQIIDLEAEYRRESPAAYLLFFGEYDKLGKEIRHWLPKSQVEDNEDGTFSVPEWLAEENGLI